MTDAQLHERMAHQETELQYLKRDVDEIKTDVSDIKEKQDQMILMLTEVKGGIKVARWFWLLLAGLVGWVLSYLAPIRAFLVKVGG